MIYQPAPAAEYVFPGLSSFIEAAHYVEKSGGNGGSLSANTPNQRTLTLEDGSITGASISAGKVVLPDGYYFFSFYSCAFEVASNRAGLLTNAGAVLIMGSNAQVTAGGSMGCVSLGYGVRNLSGGETVKLMHDQSATQASNGAGYPASSTGWSVVDNYYASLSIIRLGDAK